MPRSAWGKIHVKKHIPVLVSGVAWWFQNVCNFTLLQLQWVCHTCNTSVSQFLHNPEFNSDHWLDQLFFLPEQIGTNTGKKCFQKEFQPHTHKSKLMRIVLRFNINICYICTLKVCFSTSKVRCRWKRVTAKNHLSTSTSPTSRLIPNSFEYLPPTLHTSIFATCTYRKQKIQQTKPIFTQWSPFKAQPGLSTISYMGPKFENVVKQLNCCLNTWLIA